MSEHLIAANTATDALFKLKNYPLKYVCEIVIIQNNPTGQGPVTVKFKLDLPKTILKREPQVLMVENIFHCGNTEKPAWRLHDAMLACGVTREEATRLFWTKASGIYTFFPAPKE